MLCVADYPHHRPMQPRAGEKLDLLRNYVSLSAFTDQFIFTGQPMADLTRDTLQKIIEKEATLLRKIFDKLRGLASSVLALLGPVQSAVQLLVGKLNQIKAIVPTMVISTAKSALAFLKQFLKLVPKTLRQLTKAIGDFQKAVRGRVLETIIRTWQLVARILTTLLSNLKSVIQKLIDLLRPLRQVADTLQSLLGLLQTVFREVITVIAQLKLVDSLRMIVKKILAAIEEVLRKQLAITKAVLVDGRKLISQGG